MRALPAILAFVVSAALLAGSASAGLHAHRKHARRSVVAPIQVVVPKGGPVQIAFADDLTGFGAAIGASAANAIQMAIEAQPAIDGFPVQVNVADAPCGNPAAQVAAATSIVSNAQNVGVLGQLCSAGFQQSLPIYEAAGVVTISGSATADSLPPFAPTVFNRTAVDDGDAFTPWYGAVALLPSDLAWQQAYALRFGAAPAQFADLYYDAAGVLLTSLRQVARVDQNGNLVVNRAALAHAVRTTNGYAGVSCSITFDPRTGNRLDNLFPLANCAG